MHGLGSKHDKRVQAAPSNPSMWWRLRGQGEDGDEEEDEELEGGGDTVGEEVLEPRKDLARDPDRNDAHAAIAAQWLLHINIRNITLCTQCHLTMSDFRIATVHMLPQLTRTRAERAFERFMQGVTERRGAAASEAPMRTRKVSRNERSADADEQGQRRRHRGGAQRHAPQALAGKDDVGSGASRELAETRALSRLGHDDDLAAAMLSDVTLMARSAKLADGHVRLGQAGGGLHGRDAVQRCDAFLTGLPKSNVPGTVAVQCCSSSAKLALLWSTSLRRTNCGSLRASSGSTTIMRPLCSLSAAPFANTCAS